MIRILLVITLLYLTCPSSANSSENPQSILLANGDRITGTVIDITGDRIILKTLWNQNLDIPFDQIQPQGNQIPANQFSRSTRGPSQLRAIPDSKVDHIEPTPEPSKKPTPSKWSNNLNLGLDLQYSAVDRKVFHTRWKSDYKGTRVRTGLDYSFTYGKADGKVSANRMDGRFKIDFVMPGRWYLYSLGGVGYDEIRKIDLRYEAGPGLGLHLIEAPNFLSEKDKISMDIEVGAELEEKRFRSGREDSHYFMRLAQIFSWDINSKLKFSEKFELFPQIGNLEAHRFRLEGNTAYALWKNLSLNLTVLAESESKTVNNLNPETIQVRSSLGIRF